MISYSGTTLIVRADAGFIVALTATEAETAAQPADSDTYESFTSEEAEAVDFLPVETPPAPEAKQSVIPGRYSNLLLMIVSVAAIVLVLGGGAAYIIYGSHRSGKRKR